MWGQKFTLEGEVLDGSNKSPLAFANVILEGTSLGSASDNEGRFRIENIEAGTLQYLLLIWVIPHLKKKL